MKITRKGVGGLVVIVVVIFAGTCGVLGINLTGLPVIAMAALTVVGATMAGPY